MKKPPTPTPPALPPLGPPSYHGPHGDTNDPATIELIRRLEEIRNALRRQEGSEP